MAKLIPTPFEGAPVVDVHDLRGHRHRDRAAG